MDGERQVGVLECASRQLTATGWPTPEQGREKKIFWAGPRLGGTGGAGLRNGWLEGKLGGDLLRDRGFRG